MNYSRGEEQGKISLTLFLISDLPPQTVVHVLPLQRTRTENELEPLVWFELIFTNNVLVFTARLRKTHRSSS